MQIKKNNEFPKSVVDRVSFVLMNGTLNSLSLLIYFMT